MCGEGPTDIVVARRLIEAAGGRPGVDLLGPRPTRGKEALDRRLNGLIAGARYRRTLVLRDLDHDAACPGVLRQHLLAGEPEGLCLRIAVRSIEAWLMADHDGFASEFGLRPSTIPREPEVLAYPKVTAKDMIGRTTKRAYRQAPEPQIFGLWLSDFARENWQPARAAARSPSLARAITRLAAFCRA